MLWGCLYLAWDKYLGDGRLKEAIVKRMEGNKAVPAPSTPPIEDGFVPLSDLEIKVIDLMNDGKSEVILRIFETEFLVKKSDDGKEVLFIPYQLKPSQVELIKEDPYKLILR